MAKKKADKDAEKGPSKSRDEMTLKELFESEDDPVIKVARLIEHPPPPEPKKRPDVIPDLHMELEVIWSGMPPEPPPKPDRVAATVTTELLDRPISKGGKPHKSIGSMSPSMAKK